MMKRYQVFISSTFNDLREERVAVINNLLRYNYIPVGMELFAASNDEQMTYIKREIDNSDYYVLIIRGKYGSVDDDGISFTEKEYDYAMETGIPILIFLYDKLDELPVRESETMPARAKALLRFREKVSKSKLVTMWNDAKGLPNDVTCSLKKEIERNPREGWVRAAGPDRSRLMAEINEIKKENIGLKWQIEDLKNRLTQKLGKFEFAFEEEIYNVTGEHASTIEYVNGFARFKAQSFSVSIKWKDIFSALAPSLWENATVQYYELKKEFDNYLSNLYALNRGDSKEQNYNQIMIQLSALGMIQVKAQVHENTRVVQFTEKGKSRYLAENAIKASNEACGDQ